jgi:hypothetical protein
MAGKALARGHLDLSFGVGGDDADVDVGGGADELLDDVAAEQLRTQLP